MFLNRSIIPQCNGYEQRPKGLCGQELSGKASERRQHVSQVMKTEQAMTKSRRKTCTGKL